MAKKKINPEAQTSEVKSSGETANKSVKERLNEEVKIAEYRPSKEERIIGKYVERRIDEMIDFRKGLKIEDKWKEADEEYVPHELDFGTTRKRFETDQDTGLRSRMVPVGDATQQWRSAASAPTLLAKIQTAVSLMVDRMPEADLVATLKKYEKTTELAYALWKRNWQITDAREKLKVIIFNLIKYGWAPQRTYPRLVKYPKRVLIEKDVENPENNLYEEKELTWFDDIDREPLNPFRTWIDEMTKPYDQYSMNEGYFEIDYSYDQFTVEFGEYSNFDAVPKDALMTREESGKKVNREKTTEDQKKRQDVVTVGFFESRHKDLYVCYIPAKKLVLYHSPLPNDDGYLSITHTLWMLRNGNIPYGISLWEVIRSNKQLYDKMKNMTMDQLVLSIMKFGFFTGTSTNLGDGKIDIVPGQARQVTSSTGKPEVNWMEIPGPGADAWKGLEAIDNMIDSDSGITDTLEGEVTGKTLGEILHAKEAALKRMKTPIDNIAWLIDQDAYLTLSWMSQVYAIPTVKEFTDIATMQAFENENETNHSELFATTQEDGSVAGPYKAHYLPQLALHLEDREGKMFQSKKSKFFQVGMDKGQIHPADLKWRGIFKCIPRSIIDQSQELIKASKMELFNMLVPLLQFPPELVGRAVEQIIKVNEEDPKDWLPDAFLDFLDGKTPQGPQLGPDGKPLMPPPPGMAGPGGGAPGGAPTTPPAPGGTVQSASGMAPNTGTATVVPPGQTSAPSLQDIAGSGASGLFKRTL
jgi:hypothetical protein